MIGVVTALTLISLMKFAVLVRNWRAVGTLALVPNTVVLVIQVVEEFLARLTGVASVDYTN